MQVMSETPLIDIGHKAAASSLELCLCPSDECKSHIIALSPLVWS